MTLAAIFLLALSALMAYAAQPGQERWVTRYDGPEHDWDWAIDMVIDDSGNSYVTGTSVGNIVYGTYTTIKYDKNGHEEWVSTFDAGGGWPEAMARDDNGNIYVTGRSWDHTRTDSDAVTIKYDSSGNQVWLARYNSNNWNDEGNDVVVDNDGNVIVGGKAWSTNSLDALTVKYDASNGNQLWARHYGPSSSVSEIAVDAGNNIYVASRPGGLIKYDSAGNEQWVRDAGSYASLAIDGAGNVHVASAGFQTVKYDPSGNQLWINDHASNGGVSGIAVDSGGNVIIAGRHTSRVALIVKYDSSGNELWDQFTFSGGDWDAIEALALDSLDNIYVAGATRLTYDYNYGTAKYDPAGNQIWFQRYDADDDPAVNNHDFAYAIAVNDTGVYVAGESDSGSGNRSDLTTIKYEY